MPVASATAEPPDDPAADFVGSKGLPVAPCSALRVLPPAPHSGTFVFPMTIAPARRSMPTMASSLVATLLANSRLPNVVGKPVASIRSFTPSGRPCSGPMASPRRTDVSCRSASSRAVWKERAQNALTAGSTASMRSMQLSTSSTGEISRAPIKARASTADRSQRFVMGIFPSAPAQPLRLQMASTGS